MKTLKYIVLLLVTLICVSCDFDERIDMNTMVVVSEQEYENKNFPGTSIFRIKYVSLNHNNGLDIYVVTDKDAFEVGDRVKLIKVEE